MSDRVAHKADFARRFLLILAVMLTVAAAASFGPVHMTRVRAQATMHAGRNLRTVVKISKADDGGYKAPFYSIDHVEKPSEN
jgi:hypothetical protein